MKLADKKIIVAGGSGLIGSAIVERLESCGATVLVADKKTGYDLVDQECLDILFSQDFDGLVNATYPDSYVKHFLMFIEATRRAAKRLAVLGGGSIVNLSSIYGLVGAKDIYTDTAIQRAPTEYAAVKGGIIAMSRDVAAEYGPQQVRVNVVAPGGVFDNHPPGFVENYSARVPLGRMATPEDIAGPVAFLLSDDSGYITGQTLAVDGGLTAQ